MDYPKSALERYHHGGRQELIERIESLQSAFAATFMIFCDRSRSLKAVTFSDSIIAFWEDPIEGKRYAYEFMAHLSGELASSNTLFRGFLDLGVVVPETSALGHILDISHERFVRVMPAGIALWSVAVAEASHFPNGFFVGETIASWFEYAFYTENVFDAGPFKYKKIEFSQQSHTL